MDLKLSLLVSLQDYKEPIDRLTKYLNNELLKIEERRKDKLKDIQDLHSGIPDLLIGGAGTVFSAIGSVVSALSGGILSKLVSYSGFTFSVPSLLDSIERLKKQQDKKQALLLDDEINNALLEVFKVWPDKEALSIERKKNLEDVISQLEEIYINRPLMDERRKHVREDLTRMKKELREEIWRAEIPEGYQEILGQLYEIQGATGGVLKVSENMFDNIDYEYEMISKLIGTGTEEFKKIEKILGAHGVEFREHYYNPMTNESVMQYRFKSLEQVLSVIKALRSEGEKLPDDLDIGTAPMRSFEFLTEGTKDFSAEIQVVQQKIIQLKDYIAESVDAAQDWANLDIKKPEIEFDFGIPDNALEEHKKKLKKAFAEDMVGFVHTFDAQLKKVFGDDATTVINGFVDLFNKAGGDIEAMLTGHWDDVVALSLDALNHAMGVTTGGSNQALQVVSSAFGQFQTLLEDSGDSLTTMWEDHWENVVDIGLNALASGIDPVSHITLQTSNFSLPAWYNSGDALPLAA